jgi:YHS domain-containing protein
MDRELRSAVNGRWSEIMNQIPEPQVVKSACGGILQDPSAYPSAMFNGERVYFCANACLKAFLSAPEAFMAGEVEHPLDEDESPIS